MDDGALEEEPVEDEGGDLPADLLDGCIDVGGSLRYDAERLAFVPGDGDPLEIPYGEIARLRVGGRGGVDANRLDLTLLSGERITLLVVGREKLVEAIMRHGGWDLPETLEEASS